MKTIDTYESIVKIIRSEIIRQSELDSSAVLNATSVRGPELTRFLNEYEATSFDLSSCFIVFQIDEDEDNRRNVASETDYNGMNSIMGYKMSLKIYGNACHNVSQKILSRLKSQTIAENLFDNGIWIKEIKSPTSILEFINDTLWSRCDMTIYFIVQLEIPKLTPDNDASTFSPIKIRTF